MKKISTETLSIASSVGDDHILALGKQRQGKLYQCLGKFDLAEILLSDSLKLLKQFNADPDISYAYKYLAEIYLYKREFHKAHEMLKNAYYYFSKNQDYVLTAIIHA